MKPHRAPPRFIDTDSPLGLLMREAAADYARGLDAQRAFLRQRKDRARRAQRPALALGFAAGLAIVFGVLWQHFRAPLPPLLAQPEPERLVARASSERLIAQSEPPAPNHVSTNGEQRSAGAAPRAVPSNRAPTEQSLGSSAVASASAAPLGVKSVPELDVGTPPSAASAVVTEPARDCLGLARRGDAPAAEQCFEAQAVGQNLSAEVALYELARLRRDMLGKPGAALAALDGYTQRFPHGYLSSEVRFSRLELLVKLGRSAEVLRASDELLASSSGKERAFEIHFLRGNVYTHALNDPASAASEFAQAAASPGKLGDDAAFLEAVSLENAGHQAGAIAAFERYLARPTARHQGEARTRLTALRPGEPREAP